MSGQVYIVSGCRSPIGSMNGVLSKINMYKVMAPVLQAVVDRSHIQANDIDDVYIGIVGQAGKGPNPARKACFAAKLPIEIPATTVNTLCGSGMKSVILGYNSVVAGSASVVLAGGMESMSQAEHIINMRTSARMGDVTLRDSLFFDGLTDAMYNVHMGMTAEEVAQRYNVTREAQDAFAAESQRRCAVAMSNGSFTAEIVGVHDLINDTVIMKDEYPKPNTTVSRLAKLKPCFKKENGTVTAGNSSGLNDGAAAVILCDVSTKDRLNLLPMARIVGVSEVAIDPIIMGVSPIKAVRKLLTKVKWTIDDVDLYEINEAFAAQAIVVCSELGLDLNKVNVSGGAIALGHPVGCSGVRILVTLMYNLRRLGLKRGVCSACVGGGLGLAIAIEMC